MRITESQLRRIIRQEVRAVRKSRLNEVHSPEDHDMIVTALTKAGQKGHDVPSVSSYEAEPDLYEVQDYYVYLPPGSDPQVIDYAGNPVDMSDPDESYSSGYGGGRRRW